jgi:hypothetical protein
MLQQDPAIQSLSLEETYIQFEDALESNLEQHRRQWGYRCFEGLVVRPSLENVAISPPLVPPPPGYQHAQTIPASLPQ